MSRARDLADSADKDIAGTLTLDDLSVSGTVTGNVTGDLTGDVTGNLTGDTIGTHTGAVNATNITVTGVVTGNVTGDILGDVKADNGTVILDSGTNGRNAEFTGDVDISAIAATISDTAVDIFVYDTRKDSDGGAWRKRTQHTSWYNETLNTATRGSRKEFPAVAVIVVDNSDKITIYDGDDPDLPMWMIANTSNQMFFETNPFCVSALNAKIAIGNNPYDLAVVDFLKDESVEYATSRITVWSGGIAKRNQPNSALSGQNIETYGIISRNVNDVAMTVLPNAPIDAATGLPVPTIAVATDSGTSVITDSGNVYDITGFSPVENVNFYGDRLAINTPVGSTSYINVGSAILNSDTTSGAWEELEINSTTTNDLKILPNQSAHQAFDDTYYSAGSGGLLSVKPDYTAPETCLHAFTTSSYNTGWMNGDIKLATLSDTDATNVTGSELVTNGTFDTDVSGWSNNPTELLTWNSSGYADINRNGGSSQGQCYQYITTEIGKSYVVAVDVLAVSHGFQVYYDGNSAPSTSGSTVTNTTGTFYWFFTAQSTNTKIDLSAVQSSTATASVDNVSVKLAEADRSVNGLGLQVFGTVTKSAVASGADLVAYSGFSSSNHLKQPYNSDLDFGTGDFSCAVWVKLDSYGSRCIYHRGSGTSSNWGTEIIQLECNSTNLSFNFSDNGFASSTQVNTPVGNLGTGQWKLIHTIRRGNTFELWLDGVLMATNTSTMDLSNTTATLWVGERPYLTRPWVGSLALMRWSATAPSPEQIKKIYEDEKVLFQEGAQATLYGSSDAVTALAYDDSTNLLHVGTSAGRSVFQGLRRVDNTTTAVGAAISASNGLVADE